MLPWLLLLVVLAAGSTEANRCELPKATSLMADLESAAAAAGRCGAEAERVGGLAERVRKVVEKVLSAKEKFDAFRRKAEKIISYWGKVRPFVNILPKVGKALAKVGDAVRKMAKRTVRLLGKVQKTEATFEDRVQFAAEKLEQQLMSRSEPNTTAGVLLQEAARMRSDGLKNKPLLPFDFAVLFATAAQAAAEAAAQMSQKARKAVGVAMGCSAAHECAGKDALENVSEDLSVAAKLAESGAKTCQEGFGRVRVDVDLSFPDWKFLKDLDDLFGALAGFLDKMFGAIFTKGWFNTARCCDHVLNFLINDLPEALGDVVNLVTCWADPLFDLLPLEKLLAKVAGEFEPGVRAMNAALSGVNTVMSALNSAARFSFPIPSVVLDAKTCSVELREVGIQVFKFDLFEPMEMPGVDDGDGEGGFGGLAKSIVDSCAAAVEALITDDTPECCSTARTCAEEDRVVFFDKNGCRGRRAGTLPVPDGDGPTSKVYKAWDHGCIANDQARSVRVYGPAPAGLRIEVGDHPDTFASDDYTGIVLQRALGEDESVCVPTFEETKTTRDYKTRFCRENGLDGKVSRFAVHVGKAEVWPRCNAVMKFFSSAECKGSKAGWVSLPKPGEQMSRPVRVGNDEVRSVLIYGPSPGGVWAELGDNPKSFGVDDYALVEVSRPLAEGEELCIPTFEAYARTPRYGSTYCRENGLDGKVSRVLVHAGTPVKYDRRCWSILSFFAKNGAQGGRVGSIEIPVFAPATETYRKGVNLPIENDAAKSLVIYGPVSAGLSIEVGDDPSSFASDDYASIVLKRDLRDGEYVTIDSFEDFSDGPDFAVRYCGVNGLDGKVSRVAVHVGKEPPAWTRCRELVAFFQGKGCHGARVGAVALGDSLDKVWTAIESGSRFSNDEASSMRVYGPARAGTVVEVGDHPETFARDDYAAFVLKTDLGYGASVCVSSLETYSERPEYLHRACYSNGLDGKVSRFGLRTGAAASRWRWPRCVSEVVFYPDNGCKGAHAGALPLGGPSKIWDAKQTDLLRNDAAKSARIYGPVAAGTWIELGDNPTGFGSDDYASIEVTADLAEGEDVCVGTFEKFSVGARHEVRYCPRNGLDEKVSRVGVHQKGFAWPRHCSSKMVFLQEKGCEGEVVGSIPLQAGVHIDAKRSSVLANDKASSVRIYGPAAAGLWVELGDHPSDFASDDYATIELRQDLAEGESLCVGSFERSRDTETHRVRYCPSDGLDGTVSQVKYHPTGPALWTQCAAEVVFRKEDGCEGKRVGFASLLSGRTELPVNDEARSMEVYGPLRTGLVVEVGDNEEDFEADDYAVFVLRRDLGVGERLCVPSFEKRVPRGGDYELRYCRMNGLNGKVSKVAVREGGDVPWRRCHRAATFFEGSSCEGDSRGRLALDRDAEGPVQHFGVPNDYAQSLLLHGPVPKGTWIELGDSPGGFGDDDYAVVELLGDLGEGDVLCVSSFERQAVTGKVAVRYCRVNGLNERVSRIAAHPKGPVRWERCVSMAVLYSENDCGGSEGDSLPFGTEQIRPVRSNDKARSVRLYGPAPKGAWVEVGDSPKDFSEDDYASIQLNRALGSGETVCVGSFERGRADRYVTVRPCWKNGLDGKVSRVGMHPAGSPRKRCHAELAFYKKHGCQGNVAGFLRADGGEATYNAQQTGLLENDAGHSVKIYGPVGKGTWFEVGDNPESLDVDDYAWVWLHKEVAEGETLCIPTFEATRKDASYSAGYCRVNGLDGKVSRVAVHGPGYPRGERCHADLVFYKGTGCEGDSPGHLPITDRTSNAKGPSSTLDNDEAKSMEIFGPARAGTWIEVGDNPSSFGKDDYAWIRLKQDLAAGESLCIPTFERYSDFARYETRYCRVNGLDGKVSRVSIHTSGDPPKGRCHQELVLFDANDCGGDRVGTLDLGSSHYEVGAKTDSRVANDKAKSMRLYGPAPAGYWIEVQDAPEGFSANKGDDYSSIQLRVSLREGETLCIPTFEAFASFPKYVSRYCRVNGLDGSVSRVGVHPTGNPSRSRCREELLFYTGNGCQGNRAGVLAIKDGVHNAKKGDLILNNDEAMSVEIYGPATAGVWIEVGDNPETFDTDDYAAMRLNADLREGERLCIPTFEKSVSSSKYTVRYCRVNGLDKMVSRFGVRTRGEPSTSRCKREILFYTGNGCTDKVVGAVRLSDATYSIQDGHPVANDEAKSMRIYGPAPAGLWVELGDHPTTFGRDDYAFFQLKVELAEGEELCVGSFERSTDTSRYKVEFCRENGLDGKVSRIAVHRSGRPNSHRCRQTLVFYKENGCGGDRAGTLRIGTDGEWNAQSTSSISNDAAKSVRVYGPVSAGTWIEVGDNPSSFERDDYAVVGLRRSLSAGEEFCIPTLESSTPASRSHYSIRYCRENGLDGKVSRIGIKSSKPMRYRCERSLHFYSNNGCKGGIAGRVPFTDRVFRARDVSYFAEDEAKSVEIFGPLQKGAWIEVGDHPDRFDDDDYATVQLNADLPEGGSICIDTFEQAHRNGGYSAQYCRVNGLDGKVSRVGVHLSGGPSRSPSRCVRSVRLYSSTGCDGSSAGYVTIGNGAWNAKRSSSISNDKAQSMEVYGPAAKGTWIEVGDNPDSFATDDYGVFVLLRSLGVGERVCLTTFERTMIDSNFDYRYCPVNGLNGRLSRLAIRVWGTVPRSRCHAELAFHEKPNCGGSVRFTFDVPSKETQTYKDGSHFPNDETSSVRVYGPAGKGLIIEVGDHPSDFFKDDYSSIVLTSDVAPGNSLCIDSFERDRLAPTFRQRFNRKNGLDGKVSRIALRFFDKWETGVWVLRGLRWHDAFSEEGRGWGGDKYPIVAVGCSGSSCDNKHILAATESVCRGSYAGNLGWFSEEHQAPKVCPPNQYVGRIHCQGSKCDSMNLECIRVNTQKCSMEPHMFITGKTCPLNSVVVGARCFGGYCGTPIWYCRRLVWK